MLKKQSFKCKNIYEIYQKLLFLQLFKYKPIKLVEKFRSIINYNTYWNLSLLLVDFPVSSLKLFGKMAWRCSGEKIEITLNVNLHQKEYFSKLTLKSPYSDSTWPANWDLNDKLDLLNLRSGNCVVSSRLIQLCNVC